MDSHSKNAQELDTLIKTFTYVILFILPPILLILGCWNLYLASEMGNRDGHTLTDMFQNWQDGLDITRQYSHSYLMAMKRISHAVMQLSIALMMLGGAAVLFFKKQGKK